ncbi:hypothetical protein H6G83_26365 [Anabaena azotica FACHB-119]|uniref:Uncharacterized protein n=2 Tax=Anabaena azotica TaxID=197653 RepID=A0ABR8DA63_9NOST|nr:hypothetical protein [Anabaena azotica FACHB-119]
MSFEIQDMNLYISESDVIQAIINQRIQELKSQKPRFRLVFPHTLLAFVWLFLILTSVTRLAISAISFSLNLVVISKVYSDFVIFILSLLLIPLIVSCINHVKDFKLYKNKWRSLRKTPINTIEIESYFSGKKNKFTEKYHEYIKNVQKKVENIEKRERLSSTTADEVRSLRYRISQAVDRLEILKKDYFLRLDAVELELKSKLLHNQSDIEIEAVLESQMSVERLEEQVEAINYYLQAVDEMGWN